MTNHPTTDGPTTNRPTTNRPTTNRPTTDGLSTDAPATTVASPGSPTNTTPTGPPATTGPSPVPATDDADEIGGVHIKYLLHCPRQLWLYSHGYRPEARNEAVAFGETIDDTTYRRHAEVDLGAAKIDWVTRGAVVHETKSSRQPSPQHEAQVLHYCLLLARRGVNVRGGVVHYPLIRRTTKITWDAGARRAAETTETRARQAIAAATPGPKLPRTHCRGCSYRDYCWGDS